MREKGFFLPLVIVGVISIFLVLGLLIFWGLAIPLRLEAMKIPRYSDATFWRIESSSGWPDGSPSGNIYFKTSDKPNEVLLFYQSELTKQEWSFQEEGKTGYSDIKTDRFVETGDLRATFKKKNVALVIHSRFYYGSGHDWNYSISISR